MNIYENIEEYFSRYFEGEMGGHEKEEFLETVNNDEALLNEFRMQASIEESLSEVRDLNEDDDDYKAALLHKLGYVEGGKTTAALYFKVGTFLILPITALLLLFTGIFTGDYKTEQKKNFVYSDEINRGEYELLLADLQEPGEGLKTVDKKEAIYISTREETVKNSGKVVNPEEQFAFNSIEKSGISSDPISVEDKKSLITETKITKIPGINLPADYQPQLHDFSVDLLYNFPTIKRDHDLFGSDIWFDDFSLYVFYHINEHLEAGINLKDEAFYVRNLKVLNSKYYQVKEFTISLAARYKPFKWDIFTPYFEAQLGKNNEAIVLKGGVGFETDFSNRISFMTGIMINRFFYDPNDNFTYITGKTDAFMGVKYKF